MQCNACGEKIPSDYDVCPFCKAAIEHHPKKPLVNEIGVIGGEYGVSEKLNPKLWIILGVIAAVFGGILPGIISLVFAVKAKKLYDGGDYFTAASKLKIAKIFFWISAVIGFLSFIYNFVQIYDMLFVDYLL